jgi:YfiH family protein
MITAPGVPGVAFGTLVDGDGRRDEQARQQIAASLGIPDQWAVVDQVHGNTVAVADVAGNLGEADGLVTTRRGLPVAIGTADCVPVAIVGTDSVAMVHAGWRGVAARIVAVAMARVSDLGPVQTVVVGPHIGPCCYEVGDDVVGAIGGFAGQTAWGTTSADLASAIEAQVGNAVDLVTIEGCTMCDDRFASHRRNATEIRQVSLAWLP